jgi:hypothetical protein
MKKVIFFAFSIWFVAVVCIFSESQYFDVLFGINSIEENETLEGIEVRTYFTLVGQNDIINIIKYEQANGRTMFFLSCAERNDDYHSIRARISIDGDIREFKDDMPNYNASYNKASWSLSEEYINKLRGCNNVAIEFSGKVYRFSERDFVIDYYGSERTFENPIGQIKAFLQ